MASLEPLWLGELTFRASFAVMLNLHPYSRPVKALQNTAQCLVCSQVLSYQRTLWARYSIRDLVVVETSSWVGPSTPFNHRSWW